MILHCQKWLFASSHEEAKKWQLEMKERVQLKTAFKKPLSYIGGMDVSNLRFDPKKMVFASCTLLSYVSLEIVEVGTSGERQEFPYITGLLGFREAPALINAFRQLSIWPDLIMVDGQGVSHPRGLGIASHIGVLLDLPTIGVAKSILIGTPEGDLGENVGSFVPLMWKGEEVARLVRTKKRCSPLVISAGHKISLDDAVATVLSCLKGYRLPEPTRQAHLAANACRRSFDVR